MQELAPQSDDGDYVRPSYTFNARIGDTEFPVRSEMTGVGRPISAPSSSSFNIVARLAQIYQVVSRLPLLLYLGIMSSGSCIAPPCAAPDLLVLFTA